MDKREYRTADKSEWQRGPWDNEPDKMQWTDEATCMPCLIVRGPSGSLCGYVGVIEGHPCYGFSYSEENPALAAALEARKSRPIGDNPGMGIMLAALSGEITATADCVFEVHGGITFSDFCSDSKDKRRNICHVPGPGEPARVFWLGFDCAHAGDSSPKYDALSHYGSYRDVEYVQRECAKLAAQLAALSKENINV